MLLLLLLLRLLRDARSGLQRGSVALLLLLPIAQRQTVALHLLLHHHVFRLKVKKIYMFGIPQMEY